MRKLILCIAVFVCLTGLLSADVAAQTTKPSQVAYNYGLNKSGGKVSSKKVRKLVRKTGATRAKTTQAKVRMRAEVAAIEEAKFVITDNNYDLECTPGQRISTDLHVVKKDNTELAAKLARDYSKSVAATAVINEDNDLIIQCGFPSTRRFAVISPDFPKLYKVVTVKVNKVAVAALGADNAELTLAPSSNGQFDITPEDESGADLPLARLKATSDNPNVLLSFPDRDNPMHLTVTAKSVTKATTAKITVIAVDGDANFKPLELTVKVEPSAPSQTTDNSVDSDTDNSSAPKADSPNTTKVPATPTPVPATPTPQSPAAPVASPTTAPAKKPETPKPTPKSVQDIG